MTRSWVAWTFFVFSMAGCGAAPVPTELPAQEANTLRVSLYRPLPSLFWYRDQLALISEIVDEHVLEKLSSEIDGGPQLATSWEVGAEGRELIVHLRRTATWSDGTPFTSADVVETAAAVRRIPAGVAHLFDAYSSFEAVDAHTVRVVAAAPIGSMEGWRPALEMTVLPAHVVRDLDGASLLDPAQNPLVFRPIGTGPYRVESFVPEGRLVLVRRQDADRSASIARIELTPMSAEEAVRAVYAGTLDMADAISSDQFARTTPADGVARVAIPQNRRVQLVFRVDHPALASAAARRAITTLLRRQDLWPEALREVRVPTECFSARGSSYCPTGALVDHPEPAAAALDAAGLRDRDGDGVRELDGAPVRLRLGVTPIAHDVAATVAERLAAAGLPVDVILADANAYSAAEQASAYDLMLGSSQHGNDWGSLDLAVGSGGAYNRGNYSDAGTDALVAQLRAAEGEPERVAAYQRLVARVIEERPVVVLWQEPRCRVWSTRVRGVDEGRVGPQLDRWSLAR